MTFLTLLPGTNNSWWRRWEMSTTTLQFLRSPASPHSPWPNWAITPPFHHLAGPSVTRYACRHHPRPHRRVSPPRDPGWALSRPHIAPPPDPPAGPPPIAVGKATTAPCGTRHARAGHTLRCSCMAELRCYKDSYWMLQEMIYAIATSDRFLFYVFNLWFLMLQHIILDVLKCKC
jgi:hypothetical protein